MAVNFGLQFACAGEVSSVYSPDDQPDIVYVGIMYMGGTISVKLPKSAGQGIEEGMHVQASGSMKYQDKNGRVKCQFLGTALKPLTARESA